ncbi:MAG: lipopolysaccharide transport periplasmic protein LptA [Silicimonas sp.]|jgi:lipopolysaccharide export system protein LptA|nr:lipopolysaccharide transport periplasmic protein LptA [Silicimonas sp.]
MKRTLSYVIALCLFAGAAVAQAANIALGTGSFDTSLPVEVTADQLSVDQSNGRAVFDGNVLIVQGEVRLSAGSVTIEYAAEGSANAIERLLASGGVTFVTSSDAAEARDAVYSVAEGTVTLSGDVLLTQGRNAIAGDRLVMNLTSGNGRMEGRVRTVFSPSDGGN